MRGLMCLVAPPWLQGCDLTRFLMVVRQHVACHVGFGPTTGRGPSVCCHMSWDICADLMVISLC
jgi:hypothetical protein